MGAKVKVQFNGPLPTRVGGKDYGHLFQPGETRDDVPLSAAIELQRSSDSQKRNGRRPEWAVSLPKPKPKKREE